jgi:aminodeoxyfutalosine deaminase
VKPPEPAHLAELHLHLFGAIPPAVMAELAQRRKIDLPPIPADGYRDFDHFTAALRAMRPLVTTIEDVELIISEIGRDLAGQQVSYAEVMITPAAVAARGIDYPRQLEALARARRQVRADFGVELRWIFDIPRSGLDAFAVDADGNSGGVEYWAEATLEVALAGRDQGVVALGLSGPEAGHPPEPFAPWFDRARAAGLHSAPHAGEHAGPASVWGALRALGAERIPHGVRAIEDPALVAHLAERGIVLDVCPTSNVRLGVCPSLADHPLRRLHESGVAITVNSDDPTMFRTTISQEVAHLTGPLGLSEAEAAEIVANGHRYAFDAIPVR